MSSEFLVLSVLSGLGGSFFCFIFDFQQLARDIKPSSVSQEHAYRYLNDNKDSKNNEGNKVFGYDTKETSTEQINAWPMRRAA